MRMQNIVFDNFFFWQGDNLPTPTAPPRRRRYPRPATQIGPQSRVYALAQPRGTLYRESVNEDPPASATQHPRLRQRARMLGRHRRARRVRFERFRYGDPQSPLTEEIPATTAFPYGLDKLVNAQQLFVARLFVRAPGITLLQVYGRARSRVHAAAVSASSPSACAYAPRRYSATVCNGDFISVQGVGRQRPAALARDGSAAGHRRSVTCSKLIGLSPMHIPALRGHHADPAAGDPPSAHGADAYARVVPVRNRSRCRRPAVAAPVADHKTPPCAAIIPSASGEQTGSENGASLTARPRT